jgi:hypothetical protein
LEHKLLDLREEVSPEFYFRLADGREIKSIEELLGVIRNMEEGVFNHHVNAEKNDFMKWIEDVTKLKLIRSINNEILGGISHVYK